MQQGSGSSPCPEGCYMVEATQRSNGVRGKSASWPSSRLALVRREARRFVERRAKAFSRKVSSFVVGEMWAASSWASAGCNNPALKTEARQIVAAGCRSERGCTLALDSHPRGLNNVLAQGGNSGSDPRTGSRTRVRHCATRLCTAEDTTWPASPSSGGQERRSTRVLELP